MPKAPAKNEKLPNNTTKKTGELIHTVNKAGSKKYIVGNEKAQAVAIIPPIDPADTAYAIDAVVILAIALEINSAIKTSVGAIHGPIGVANET